MAEMMRKGLGGMNKMGSDFPKGELKGRTEAKPAAKSPVEGEHEDGEEKVSTITHHADGTHTSQMEGGEPEEHPDHMHLMAHIGHHLTGGDAHHVEHHDGMESHHHSIEEDGEHHEGELHGDGEDDEMGHADEMSDEHEMAPQYGGIGM